MQSSIQSRVDELVENFSLFDDWEERYRYLIDLGRKLPEMDEALKTDDRLVKGCTSRVWMEAHVDNGIFHFQGDSDAHIVRGLIGVLDFIFQGQKVSDIPTVDIDKAFKDIGLDQHLSPNRRNGFFAMVERIRSLSAP